jgi:PTS system mannose-specific IID component
MQVSFNFWRMQGLGFTFAMLPLVRCKGNTPERIASQLERHLKMFNTHPYLAASVLGSVVRIEQEGQAEEADHLKTSVMGPYAAIGDPFFWGVLRTFSAAAAVLLALKGILLAPLAFLLLYNPAHLWVRGKGFLEGYRRGQRGIDFIRGLNLPAVTVGIRLPSLILIGILAAVTAEAAYRSWPLMAELPVKLGALALILLCFLGVRRGISPLLILYGMTGLCMVLSI